MDWARVMRLVREGAEAGPRRVRREVGVVLGRAGFSIGIWDENMSYSVGLGATGKSSPGYLLRGHVPGLPVKKAVSFSIVVEVPETVRCAELLRFLV